MSRTEWSHYLPYPSPPCKRAVLLLTHDDALSRKTLHTLQSLSKEQARTDPRTPRSSPPPCDNHSIIVHPRPFCITKVRLSPTLWDKGYVVSTNSVWPTVESRDENLLAFVKRVIHLSPANLIVFLVRPLEIVRLQHHRILASLKHVFSLVAILHSEPKSALASQCLEPVPHFFTEDIPCVTTTSSAISVCTVHNYLQTWANAVIIVRQNFPRKLLSEHDSRSVDNLALALRLPADKKSSHNFNLNGPFTSIDETTDNQSVWNHFLLHFPLDLRVRLSYAFHDHLSSSFQANCTAISDEHKIQNHDRLLNNVSQRKRYCCATSIRNAADLVDSCTKPFSIALLLPDVSRDEKDNDVDHTESMLRCLESSNLQPRLCGVSLYVYALSAFATQKWKRLKKHFSKLQICLLRSDSQNRPRQSYACMWVHLANKAVEDGNVYLALLTTPWVPKDANWVESLCKELQNFKNLSSTSCDVGRSSCSDSTHALVALSSTCSFSSPISSVVLHSCHLQTFPDLLPQPFHDYSVAPEDAFAFLRTLYLRFARFKLLPICHHSRSPTRCPCPHRTIRYKGDILSRSIQILSEALGPSLMTIDVIVPTFRLPLDGLRNIASLRANKPVFVCFWFVVDNPDNTSQVSALLSLLDGSNENGNYVVSVIVNSENLGAARARNTGLAWSDADWVVMLDDDVDPHPRLLDAYIAGVCRNPEAVVLTGVINFPKPVTIWHHALKASELIYFFGASGEIPHLPWPVTGNTCVRGRENENFVFLDKFPKGGGGEDIDFGLRIKGVVPTCIVSVPDAQVDHPWFDGLFGNATAHMMNYMKGDSIIEATMGDKTYTILPGWAEILAVFLPVVMFIKSVTTCIRWAGAVAFVELLCRASAHLSLAYESTNRSLTSVPAALLAASLHMAQDLARVYHSLRRMEWRTFFRRLDRFDGLKDMRYTQIAMALRTILYIAILYRCVRENN